MQGQRIAPLAFSLALATALAVACKPETISPFPDDGGIRTSTSAGFVPAAIQLPDPSPNFFEVWGRSADDVYLVGERGLVYHLTGGTWIEETTTATSSLLAVWGTNTGDVYAVGTGGMILHRGMNGEWLREMSPVGADLHDVGGLADGRIVIAVGTNGTVLHRAAATGWAVVPSDTLETLNGLWVAADGRSAAAVGNLGTIIKFDGSVWRRQRVAGLTVPMQAVWGTGSNNLYAVGLDGTILRSSGSRWSEIEGAPRVYLRDVFGTSMDNAFIVGWGGTIARTDGTKVEVVAPPSEHRLEGVWGTLLEPEVGPDGEEIVRSAFYLVGVTGVVLTGP